MEVKYAAVNGSRGPDVRCLAYGTGPMRTAQEARKRAEPDDHLVDARARTRTNISDVRDMELKMEIATSE